MMVLTLISLFTGIALLIIIIRLWLEYGEDRITELYTCTCGSNSHLWLTERKLECTKCGMVKEVNHNGIIVRQEI